MIGPLEIVVVVVLVLLFLGYRTLPALGRRAGEHARGLKDTAGAGASELKRTAQGMIGDRADPEKLGRQAGRGLREARELRDAVTGKDSTPAASSSDRDDEAS